MLSNAKHLPAGYTLYTSSCFGRKIATATPRNDGLTNFLFFVFPIKKKKRKKRETQETKRPRDEQTNRRTDNQTRERTALWERVRFVAFVVSSFRRFVAFVVSVPMVPLVSKKNHYDTIQISIREIQRTQYTRLFGTRTPQRVVFFFSFSL